MPSLLVRDAAGAESRVLLEPGRHTVLGRDACCEVVLPHPSISRRHAVISLADGAYTIEDVSTNGLFVNGTQIAFHRLADGDRLVLGAASEHPILFSSRDSRLEMTMTRLRDELGGELRADAESLRKLIEVNKAITTSLEIEEVFELLLEGILEIAAGTRAMILLRREDGELRTAYEKNLERGGSAIADAGISRSVVRRVLESGRPVLINDVADDAEFGAQASIQALDLRSIVAIPLSYSRAYLTKTSASVPLMGVIYVDSRAARRRFEREDFDLLLAFAAQGAISLENARLHRRLQESYLELVMSLAGAVEIKDRYTRGHSELVSRYSVAVAERLGMGGKQVEVVRRGGMLHDVGKIGIDEAVLNKKGRLTVEEYEAIKKHPVYGADILGPIGFLRGERDIVLQHHEKMDGSGYPRGLRGDQISIGARIVAVCDVFEGVTSNRPYRKPMKPEEVVDMLEKEAGEKLDASVVQAFLELYEEAGYRKGAVGGSSDQGVRDSISATTR